MRISDWSSDVCSSDLLIFQWIEDVPPEGPSRLGGLRNLRGIAPAHGPPDRLAKLVVGELPGIPDRVAHHDGRAVENLRLRPARAVLDEKPVHLRDGLGKRCLPRPEEHTSDLQSLMSLPFAVFCLKK